MGLSKAINYDYLGRFYHKINGSTMMLKPRIIIAVLILSCSIIFSQDQSDALLYRRETKVLHSDIVGVDFEIHISLPVDYYRSDTTYYPVLFSTDANRAFGMVSDLVYVLSFPGHEIPKLVVVGIGYKIKGLEEWAAGRNRDLLPTNDPEADKEWDELITKLSGRKDVVSRSGGAEKFLQFIREELIPFIETNYRVKRDDRALIGYSYGGEFTLYTLFTSPETFQRYYAGSASMEWDNKVIFKYEKEYADTHKDLPATLFMSFGSLEEKTHIADMYEMAALLESHNYKSLKLETHLFNDENHSSCLAGGLSRALRMIYK
jgi:predicted alpha/beta superfamily hydrolase